jgi:hypothetical protein
MGTAIKIKSSQDMTPAQRKAVLRVLTKTFRAASLVATGSRGGLLKAEHYEEAF